MRDCNVSPITLRLSGRTGQEERSRRISQHILGHLLGSELERSTDASCLGLETLERLFQRDYLKKMAAHEDKQIRHAYECFVAKWIALSVGTLSPFCSSSSAAMYDRDSKAGAVALIAAIRGSVFEARPRGFHGPGGCHVHLSRCFDWQPRRSGRLDRLDDARATAARLMAIARRFVREYPDSPHSYRVLSDAHHQIKKNAFRTGDDNLIEQSLVQAVKAARAVPRP